ncbi:MAG TPA: ABC transporter ATP-binding protein [Gaiellaceae bacterium]|nr:ABC transporter ATP-binding protein [Gaiellaceae bacterium]
MPEPFLSVTDLNAFYGRAQALHGVTFEMEREPVAVIGRNGMGKTTLCLALMGLMAQANGSVRFEGQELMGRAPYKIAEAGIGYVPQGRRLFPSLSTEEHLDMLGGGNGGRWNKRALWELFPRLAERRKVGAAQLSGGEQQMLAIARALLGNPSLLIMDEPSEGLAPTIVESLVETCLGLVREGVGLLLIEQNLGVATSLAERQLVMVAGEIAAETTARELLASPEAQQRYLGVTRVESASA